MRWVTRATLVVGAFLVAGCGSSEPTADGDEPVRSEVTVELGRSPTATVHPGGELVVRFIGEAASVTRGVCWTLTSGDGEAERRWALTTAWSEDAPPAANGSPGIGIEPVAVELGGELTPVCPAIGWGGEGPDRLAIPDDLTEPAKVCEESIGCIELRIG